MIDKKKIAALAVAATVIAPNAIQAAPIGDMVPRMPFTSRDAAKRAIEFAVVGKDNEKLDIKDGVFELVKKDTKDVLATFDFSKDDPKTFEAEVGTTYVVNMKTAPTGYTAESTSVEFAVEAGEGNQVVNFVMAEGQQVTSQLTVTMTDKESKEAVKTGTVTVREKGSETDLATFDFSKDDPKTCQLTAGKTYVLTATAPAGYVAENSPREIVVADDGKAIVEDFVVVKASTEAKRVLEVKHVDADSKEALAGGKVEIMEKDKTEVLATIDFAQANKNTAELEVGKTYIVKFKEAMTGYKPVYDSYEVKMVPNAEGKTENQQLVVESKKDEGNPNPGEGDKDSLTKDLVAIHVDKDTNKEIKEGTIIITEVGSEKEPMTYDFSKSSAENNLKVENGKTYNVEFSKFANGYVPENMTQKIAVDFGENSTDSYVLTVYSSAVNENGAPSNGSPNVNGGSTTLPKTGVAAPSIGLAVTTLIGSLIGMKKRF